MLEDLFVISWNTIPCGHAEEMHKADGVRVMGWVGKTLRLRILSRL